MPDHRKPSIKSTRPEPGPRAPADSDSFSIESTTMRLKSMRLRRAEVEKQEAAQIAGEKTDTADMPRGDRPSGRVRHDERGVAVWDWAVASGEFQTLSATRAMKKLGIADLKI